MSEQEYNSTLNISGLIGCSQPYSTFSTYYISSYQQEVTVTFCAILIIADLVALFLIPISYLFVPLITKSKATYYMTQRTLSQLLAISISFVLAFVEFNDNLSFSAFHDILMAFLLTGQYGTIFWNTIISFRNIIHMTKFHRSRLINETSCCKWVLTSTIWGLSIVFALIFQNYNTDNPSSLNYGWFGLVLFYIPVLITFILSILSIIANCIRKYRKKIDNGLNLTRFNVLFVMEWMLILISYPYFLITDRSQLDHNGHMITLLKVGMFLLYTTPLISFFLHYESSRNLKTTRRSQGLVSRKSELY